MTAAGSAVLGNPAGSEGPARLLLGPWLLALLATELLVLFSGTAVAGAAGAVLVLGPPPTGWRPPPLRAAHLLSPSSALCAPVLASESDPRHPARHCVRRRAI